MRPLIAIAVIILLLVGGKFYLSSEAKETAKGPSPRAAAGKSGQAMGVDVYLAALQPTENVVYSSGTVVPNEEVTLQSEASGRLVELNLKEGGYVKKGDLIARIDSRDLDAQLKKLQFEEDLAEQIKQRQQKLLDIDAISKEEYEISVNNVNTLTVDKEMLKVMVQKTEVRAPFNGYIGFKQVSLGAYLTPGVEIATLVQTNPAKIDFAVPEKYAASIKPGQEINFEVDGLSDLFTAQVRAIDPRVDPDLRTLQLRAVISNPGRRLLPGMFVRVSVPLGKEESIMIPTESVVPILKGKMVYVLRKGKATSVEIETGVRTDEKVQVREGLEIGDSVIVSALMSLKQGLPVRAQAITNTSE